MFRIKKANDKKHKFVVLTPNDKKIKFGAYGYEDYTIHKDKERKKRYIERHKKEDWTDKEKAGFWSRWILWNKPTLKESIEHTEKKFNININF